MMKENDRYIINLYICRQLELEKIECTVSLKCTWCCSIYSISYFFILFNKIFIREKMYKPVQIGKMICTKDHCPVLNQFFTLRDKFMSLSTIFCVCTTYKIT